MKVDCCTLCSQCVYICLNQLKAVWPECWPKVPRKEDRSMFQPGEPSGKNNTRFMKFYFWTTEPPYQTDMYMYVASIQMNFTVKILPFISLTLETRWKYKEKTLENPKGAQKKSKTSKDASTDAQQFIYQNLANIVYSSFFFSLLQHVQIETNLKQ